MSKDYRTMTDDQVKTELRRICAESSTEDEVRQKVASELGYPYGLAITTHQPTDTTGRQARSLVRALGGPIMKNGAMIMLMMHGPQGVISL